MVGLLASQESMLDKPLLMDASVITCGRSGSAPPCFNRFRSPGQSSGRGIGCTKWLLSEALAITLHRHDLGRENHRLRHSQYGSSHTHHFWQPFRVDFIPAFETPMVLGNPWLHCHNPQINWVQGKVVSWHLHCHSFCLRSALTPR